MGRGGAAEGAALGPRSAPVLTPMGLDPLAVTVGFGGDCLAVVASTAPGSGALALGDPSMAAVLAEGVGASPCTLGGDTAPLAELAGAERGMS